MQQQRLEVCSFCGQSDIFGFLSPSGAAQVCERCAADMQSAASHDRDRQVSEYMHQSDLLEEWMLLVFPVTILLIGIVLQRSSVLAPLLQAFGVIFIVAVICYESWARIVRRSVRPGFIAPLAWIGCGAFLGYPAGYGGLLVGVAIGIGSWVGCRSTFKRMKLTRILKLGVSSTRRN
jgi:hypothetical protein